MDLMHIPLADLSISASNMRGRGVCRDLGSLLPSVRARGVLVPLIVRPTASGGETGDGESHGSGEAAAQ